MTVINVLYLAPFFFSVGKGYLNNGSVWAARRLEYQTLCIYHRTDHGVHKEFIKDARVADEKKAEQSGPKIISKKQVY